MKNMINWQGLIWQKRREGDAFDFFHFNVALDNGPCVAKRLAGCGAGHEYFAITPEGDIYPCHQFVGREEYKLGTLETGVVNLIWYKNSDILM